MSVLTDTQDKPRRLQLSHKSKVVGKTVVGVGALISLITGIHNYFFPRTEASQLQKQVTVTAERVDKLDEKYDKKIDDLKDKMSDMHSDIRSILIIERQRASR